MPSTTQVTVHYDAVDNLRTSEETRALLKEAALPIVFNARGGAPKDTGAGARSVASAMVLTSDEWEALISWDQFHYYMRFSELDTRQRPARPFLVPSLRAAQR